MNNKWDWKRFGKAWKIFSAVMRGREYVPKSSVANEELIEFPHPDGPGGCTREELYYGSSNLLTFPTSVPVRPVDIHWVCTKCKQPVKITDQEETLGKSGTGNIVADIACPCGQVNEHINYCGLNGTLYYLSIRAKIAVKP